MRRRGWYVGIDQPEMQPRTQIRIREGSLFPNGTYVLPHDHPRSEYLTPRYSSSLAYPQTRQKTGRAWTGRWPRWGRGCRGWTRMVRGWFHFDRPCTRRTPRERSPVELTLSPRRRSVRMFTPDHQTGRHLFIRSVVHHTHDTATLVGMSCALRLWDSIPGVSSRGRASMMSEIRFKAKRRIRGLCCLENSQTNPHRP